MEHIVRRFGSQCDGGWHGVFVGSGEARLPAPSPHSHECFYNIEFECVSPSDRGSHFSLGASSSGLRSLAVAWDAGSRPSVASARGPTAGGHGDSPLKPSSPGRNMEAAPGARLIVFRFAMDHLGANVMERSG